MRNGNPNFYGNLGGERTDGLRALSERTGRSMAECLRRMIDACGPVVSGVLAGAAVTGVEVHTTSGSFMLERIL